MRKPIYITVLAAEFCRNYELQSYLEKSLSKPLKAYHNSSFGDFLSPGLPIDTRLVFDEFFVNVDIVTTCGSEAADLIKPIPKKRFGLFPDEVSDRRDSFFLRTLVGETFSIVVSRGLASTSEEAEDAVE